MSARIYPVLVEDVPQGNNLYWSSITVTAKEENKSVRNHSSPPLKVKEILHNVSGMAESGKLLAVMGSSGAGKTTLLNVLTQRGMPKVHITGSLMIDGQKVNKYKLREMGLSVCANTMIGIPNAVKGLSCGEQKRLAFASEILTYPSILFCDEPTSGLDSFMAAHVVSCLRSLADGGMTVVITIHQPSTQVYHMFHNVCLMACGRIIYLGGCDQAAPLFSRAGFECPPYYNPADHLIRTLAVIDSDKKNSFRNITKIREAFLGSEAGRVVKEIAKSERMTLESEPARSIMGGTFGQRYAASYWTQVSALFTRTFINVLRNPLIFKIRVIQTIVTALITGAVYWQTPVSIATIMTINGILFNHIRNLNFMLQFPAVPEITTELPLVYRENQNGIYRTSAYFLAKNLAELPQYIFLPFLYIAIVYWMSGLVPFATNFLMACFICILITQVSISISYAVACIFEDTAVSMTFLPIFVVPIMAFGGFFITFDAIPSYFKWLSALSYFKYSYEALAINEWTAIEEISGSCGNSTWVKCARTGEEVLHSIDFSSSMMYWDIAILFAILVFFRLLALVALLFRTNQQH